MTIIIRRKGPGSGVEGGGGCETREGPQPLVSPAARASAPVSPMSRNEPLPEWDDEFDVITIDDIVDKDCADALVFFKEEMLDPRDEMPAAAVVSPLACQTETHAGS